MSRFPIPEIDTDAFPIAKPLPEHDMRWVSRRYTPCQILREIFQEIDDPEIKLKCRIACNMTKTMATKLSELDPKWARYTWPYREKNWQEVLHE